MKSNRTDGLTPQVKLGRGAEVKSPPKTSFGAALAKKSAELAEQQARAQQEKEVVEAVGTEMARSVLDMPDAAQLEPEQTDDDQDSGQGW